MKMMRVILNAITAGVLMAGPAGEAGIDPKAGAIVSKTGPRIEAVFVLDTTGSMSGLINAAKEKIWSIASTLGQAEPAPEIRIGLVGYRDRGDEYVTRITPLSSDLDRVYSDLMAYRADGGGDGPESVNQALAEAVDGIGWSNDGSTYRVIFLVGDYPPHMDYENDTRYPETCLLAKKKDIIVNTIQCGTYSPTTPVWQEIALLAGGVFFRVEQSGGAIEAATPYDEELARLSRELDGTRVFYGDKVTIAAQEERVRMAEKIYREAPAAAVAQRAAFNESEAGRSNLFGDKELVSDVSSGAVELAKLDAAELPEEMREMSAEERAAHVETRTRKRNELQAKIRELADKRQRHIKDEVKKADADTGSSLDHQLYETIRTQAAGKEIRIEKGPVY